MKGAIVPSAVGVDIGCGMAAVETQLVAADLPDNLVGMGTAIKAINEADHAAISQRARQQ